MRISDWSSDVCSSDLRPGGPAQADAERLRPQEDAREGRLMANRVTFKGLSGLQADLDAVAADLTSGMPKAEEAVAESLAQMIRDDAPVDTGDLRASVESEGNEVSGGGSRAPYAADAEEVDRKSDGEGT